MSVQGADPYGRVAQKRSTWSPVLSYLRTPRVIAVLLAFVAVGRRPRPGPDRRVRRPPIGPIDRARHRYDADLHDRRRALDAGRGARRARAGELDAISAMTPAGATAVARQPHPHRATGQRCDPRDPTGGPRRGRPRRDPRRWLRATPDRRGDRPRPADAGGGMPSFVGLAMSVVAAHPGDAPDQARCAAQTARSWRPSRMPQPPPDGPRGSSANDRASRSPTSPGRTRPSWS